MVSVLKIFSSSFCSNVSSSVSSSCQLQGQFHVNRIHKTGDVVLGGLFAVHFFSVLPELSFTSELQEPICHGFNVLGFRQFQTMAFAIDEINRNSNLLPNVTLGYSLYDSCAILGVAFRAALSMLSGQGDQFLLDNNCIGPPPVLGIVGESSSTRSIAISAVLGLYRVPMVSYFATCSCLSDRQRFPSFFRTIPSDAFQVRAMLQILKRFGWTWVGLLISDNDYGLNAARSLQSDLAQSGGGCLAYAEVLPRSYDTAELRRIVNVMKKSTARSRFIYVTYFNSQVVKQNVTGLQWIASEAWTAATVLQTPNLMPYLGGTLGIAIRRGEIPGLRDFLLRIRPESDPMNYKKNLVRYKITTITYCQHIVNILELISLCTGQEDLESLATTFLDMSDLRPEYNVYKAVYALAYALDDMLQCVPGRGPFSGHSCASLQKLQPWQVRY
uniref:Receptor ligand binding region domain-containing protein n=1 Tax=Myripristis murdjan TaxID=586833 RepID=A0A667X640_9TELE